MAKADRNGGIDAIGIEGGQIRWVKFENGKIMTFKLFLSFLWELVIAHDQVIDQFTNKISTTVMEDFYEPKSK